MARIAILTDSGCQMKSTDGIYVVPLQVSVLEDSYQDGVTIDSQAVFQMMQDDPGCMPKTSQPSSGDIVAALTEIKAAGYDEVIAITIATGLSSTLSGMKVAADLVDIPMRLIDSKGTAGNQRYLVKTAKKYIESGKSSEEIASKLEALVEHSATVIMAPNLKHLKQGGRITPAVAALGGMLKIVPVMKLNLSLGGKIDSLGKVRTTKKAILTMVQDMVDHGVNSEDYIITVEHVLCEEHALELVNHIRETFGENTPIDFELLPSVVGVHMGIGGIGVQYIKKADD